MVKAYDTTLFIFRRDIRLADNSALINALANSKQVIPCYIFDPRLLDQHRPHLYAVQLLFAALQDLDAQLLQIGTRLHCLSGPAEKVLESILTFNTFDALFLNRDYSPFSHRRDRNIQAACEQTNVVFQPFADALLNEPEIVLKTDGTPYKVFTPFFNKATQILVPPPKTNQYQNYGMLEGKVYQNLAVALKKHALKPSTSLFVQGSRAACQAVLDNLTHYRDYDITRDLPAIHGTTRLSPYLKFGLCSIREAYASIKNQLGATHPLIRQLYWRDFYIYIAYHFPHVFTKAFKPRFERIEWNHDSVLFQTWCEGRTGFPIVDAGMRELVTTGWMHNRVRMIVASFLTKDLHIDWRWGERFFAEHLVDYDPAVNNGNWQWSASTGADAQPYFRIFNPWRQQEKYDKECSYIKQWIPELSKLEPRTIHQWYKSTPKDSYIDYPKPIVDHKTESQYSKQLYSSTFQA
ncbi:MAG: deoxyribodipyrimidine photo-lyase [Candidatus Hermodarchaeota archaeon]|nr:deoxyribodipyrimidine photo-lyase [Candidatus Hermodarchaeota archaeon]